MGRRQVGRPIIFSCSGPRPGPARPMTFATKIMGHGLYMGRPDISVGWSVDLKSWPKCVEVGAAKKYTG